MSDFSQIPTDWREALDPIVDWSQFAVAQASVEVDRDRLGGRVYPPASEVFAAFHETPFAKVRVVILGQDPYYRPGQAHGLAFSLRSGAEPFPGSLANILNEVERDYGPGNRDGSLVPWARRGVLLLNTALTVVERGPASHLDEWSPFTDAVIEAIARRTAPVIFMLWGRKAEAKSDIVKGRHPVQVRSHPSGLAAYRNFRHTAPFREANTFLANADQPGVEWVLPLP